MATHAQIEAWWQPYRCNTDGLVSLDMNGRYPVRLQAPLEAAGLALSEAITSNGYRHPMGPTGSYNCRKIGGSDTWSLHAYAVAVDWSYAENPMRGASNRVQRGFGTSDLFMLTEQQVNAVEAIVNEDGDSIWRWLGWTIGDFMHFQVDVPPDKCQPKETTVPTYRDVENVPDFDWARDVVDWGIDNRIIITTDDHQDDWLKNAGYGQLWTMLMRMDQTFH